MRKIVDNKKPFGSSKMVDDGILIKGNYFIISSLFLLFLVAILSMSFGRYPISVKEIFQSVFTSRDINSDFFIVLLNIRLPRIIGAVTVGGALSIAGAAYQGMFRNPMVSPDILGVTSGAGFGACLAILLSLPIAFVQVFSFVGGVGAVFFVVALSKWIGKKQDHILVLVLSGIVISSLFSAMLGMLKYIADPNDKLPAIMYWLMGSLSSIRLDDLYVVVPIVICSCIPLIFISWRINVLSFGEAEARSLGVNTGRLRTVIIICASMATASTISITGIIGWIGLVIPHLTRMLVGPNHKILLPASFLLGGLFMLIVDNVARTLASIEVPIGILTSVFGAPLFIFFIKKSKIKSW